MTNHRLSLAVAIAVLSTAAAAQTAKPSPYQGVSVPPANDVITTTDAAPAQQPATQPPPAAAASSNPASGSPASGNAASGNPDAGIVETPLPPPSSEAMATATSPDLRTRRDSDSFDTSVDNPDDRIVTYVPGPANALPEGTAFRVRMLQEINAEETNPGTAFRAQLTQDLLRDGRVVIPAGSELRGKVVYATSGRRIGGPSVIHLRADEFILPDGTHYRLHAEVIDTQGSDTKATGEGNIVPKDHVKRTLTEFAVGSGGGALLGAKVGGGVGAVVGSAVGAGAVTAHWLLAEHSAELPAESTVVFSLTDPMFLTPARD